MIEDLTNATHSAAFLVNQLQDALRVANAVEAILILDMIEAAAKLKWRVEMMLSAKEEEAESLAA